MQDYKTAQAQKSVGKQARERNTCSVVATSIVCNIDYSKAHAALEQHGRKKGKGVLRHVIHSAVETLGCTLRQLDSEELVQRNGSGYTASTIGKLCKKGRFLVYIRGHVFAVVDGVVQDWTAGRRHRVVAVFEVTGGNVPAQAEVPAQRKTVSVKRPKLGTVCNHVWAICDTLNARGQGRAEMLAACAEVGINAATARTQFQRWKSAQA